MLFSLFKAHSNSASLYRNQLSLIHPLVGKGMSLRLPSLTTALFLKLMTFRPIYLTYYSLTIMTCSISAARDEQD